MVKKRIEAHPSDQQYDDFKAALAQCIRDRLVGTNADEVTDRAHFLAALSAPALWRAIVHFNHRVKADKDTR